MWIILFILRIKLNMPVWYWILFTIITIIRPAVGLFEYELNKQLMDRADK